MRKTIAQNMVVVLEKYQRVNVWYGDIELIEECAKISGVMKKHPKDTIQCVLNALDKSSLFCKAYIISDFNGRKRKYRCFNLAI